MNVFVKKEIRLLLPSWMVILVLAILAPWFSWKDPDTSFAWTPLIVFFGVILVAVDSFGREFSLGTFSSLMAQPVERRQIWRTKITILLIAAALIFLAYFISSEFLLHRALKIPVWAVNPEIIGADFRNAMFAGVAVLFVALAGGLWTTLLFRQIAAAFWITFLVPAGMLMLIVFTMSKFFNHSSEIAAYTVLYGAAISYIILSSWFAHRLFHRAQDAAWTGGVIDFATWRYFDSGSRSVVSTRRRKPIFALAKKEFQLQSISLVCAGALLALHVVIILVRTFHGDFEKNSLASVVSDMFWVLWLVMPIVIGSMAVAEERKLGVAESQLCLPVSRRVQFVIKFIPTLIFGVLLGGVMPLLLETLAKRFGAPDEYFRPESHAGGIFSGIVMFQISIVALSAGLALAALFASTLAKNFLQALSIAIVTIIGCCLFTAFLADKQLLSDGRLVFLGVTLWNPVLPLAIAMLTAIAVFPWLAGGNFSRFQESGRLWRRNIFGIVGAVLFVFAVSTAIYNRAWEIFEPAEPPHGAAKFSLANPPTLQDDFFSGLQVRLPDGRIWFDNLGGRLPTSTGPQQFMAGSNWVSATTRRVYFEGQPGGYLDTVGIQRNGTLWLSSEAKPVGWKENKMIQFGDETNWQQVIQSYASLLLLKKDGTLWQWGIKLNDLHGTNWPSVHAFKLRQIGTNSDWKELLNPWGNYHYAMETDGSVWVIAFENKTGKVGLERATNLDRIAAQNFSQDGGNKMAYVGKNGTLWICDRRYENGNWTGTGFLQVGGETNWVNVAVTWNWMVALKSDGTLWKWNFPPKSTGTVAKIPPTRLGIHDDWVAIAGFWEGTVSLAADGSLWYWPAPEQYEQNTLMKLPKQPEFLGNVFTAH